MRSNLALQALPGGRCGGLPGGVGQRRRPPMRPWAACMAIIEMEGLVQGSAVQHGLRWEVDTLSCVSLICYLKWRRLLAERREGR